VKITAAAAAPRAETPAAHTPANMPEPVAPAGASVRGEAKVVHLPKAAQEEFGFGEVESRGHFEKTDRNLHEGQDLDVPTYLRKGIKIQL
jgi:cell division protein FtsZ